MSFTLRYLQSIVFLKYRIIINYRQYDLIQSLSKILRSLLGYGSVLGELFTEPSTLLLESASEYLELIHLNQMNILRLIWGYRTSGI